MHGLALHDVPSVLAPHIVYIAQRRLDKLEVFGRLAVRRLGVLCLSFGAESHYIVALVLKSAFRLSAAFLGGVCNLLRDPCVHKRDKLCKLIA